MARTNKYSFIGAIIFCFLISPLGCKENNSESLTSQKESQAKAQDTIWVNKLTQAYRTLYKGRSIEAADQLIYAADLMPIKNWEIYFVAATIYSEKNKKNKAFQSLEKAIQFGLRDAELVTNYPDLSNIRNDVRWKEILPKLKKEKQKYLEAIQNPALLKELENMWEKDQLALVEYEENIKALDSNATVSEYRKLFKPVERQWDINKKKLDSIVNIHGWPGYRLVGEDGAKISWAIPQHHPDVFFKERCLKLIKKAVDKADASPNHIAELTDRIAREKWQKQTYGASMGQEAPYPIEDASNVDMRRIALGLPEPIEVYAYYHGIEYRPPSEKEARKKAKATYDKAQRNYRKFEEFLKIEKVDSINV